MANPAVSSIAPGVLACGVMSIVECPSSLVVIDPGDDAAEAQSVTGTSVAALVEFADGREKPVEHVILTHHHLDQIHNLRVLEQFWPHLRVIAHTRTSLSHAALVRVERDTQEIVDTIAFRLVPSPGHSAAGDDLSILLPDLGMLFCGDLWQPQGQAYERAGGPSPVPAYSHGRAFLDSLARLVALNFRVLRTGHNATLDRSAALRGFEVMRQTVLRTQELAQESLQMLPGAELDALCWWIFGRVAAERGWSEADILARRSAETQPGMSDYERFDRPGIAYWVKESARAC